MSGDCADEKPDLLMLLREEILAAVSRHVALDPDKVIVRMERGKNVSTLEVDVELPSGLERHVCRGELIIKGIAFGAVAI